MPRTDKADLIEGMLSTERLRRQESWAVTVERNGEQVVTLASNCLAGRDLSADDERVIRMAAQHLLSFVGVDGGASGDTHV